MHAVFVRLCENRVFFISYLHRYVVSLTLKIGVVSQVIPRQISYLHRYVESLNVINIWRSKAVSTPSNPNSPHTMPNHHHLQPYPANHIIHFFMFLSYCITYKAISSPLVAAVASAAAVAVAPAAAVVPLAGAAVATATAEVVVGAAAVVSTTSDLTHFRHRNLNF